VISVRIQDPDATEDPASLSGAEFFETYIGLSSSDRRYLTLDGVQYNVIDTTDIPVGYAEVDVKLDDNGEVFECALLSGHVGTRVRDSKETKKGRLRGSGLRDVVSPVAGWWMYEKLKM
jgi:hypothetical protein